MRSILSLGALALATATTSAPSQAQAPTAPAAAAPAAPVPPCQTDIKKGSRKALIDLQTAVAAKNSAAIPGLVAAAQAVAKTGDEKCFIGLMQMKAGIDANDPRAAAVGLEAQLASGKIPAEEIAKKFEALGQMQLIAKVYDDAGSKFERSLQIAPNRGTALVLLAETRTKQNRVADALPLYKKAIAAELAAGRKPDEKWYRRSVAVAYDAKSPLVYSYSRDWITAYPNATNWRDAIRIYDDRSGLDDAALLDMFRLARLNKALASENDYNRYVQVLIGRGYAGEAVSVLDEGFAAKALDRNKLVFKESHALATKRAAGDRASLDGQVKAAQAGAAAKPLMALGEAYYGYGDYAKAAAMFRAAQGKGGVDAELANLRLGMSLAASGDKAGATAALNLVTGPRAEIARYWLTYLATRG
jgi:tetratricopeptide (TPR) repeat protein